MLGIKEAVERLRSGGVVAIPTETVYGLAAEVTNLQAIQEIFFLKRRPSDKPLIVHVSSLKQLSEILLEKKNNINKELSKVKKNFLDIGYAIS